MRAELPGEIEPPDLGDYPQMGAWRVRSIREGAEEEVFDSVEVALESRLSTGQWPTLAADVEFWISERLEWAACFAACLANAGPGEAGAVAPSWPVGTKIDAALRWLVLDLYHSNPAWPVRWRDAPQDE